MDKKIFKNLYFLNSICLMLALAPGLFVWLVYPAIRGKTEEHRNKQMAGIITIGSIPFIFMTSYLIFIYIKKLVQ